CAVQPGQVVPESPRRGGPGDPGGGDGHGTVPGVRPRRRNRVPGPHRRRVEGPADGADQRRGGPGGGGRRRAEGGGAAHDARQLAPVAGRLRGGGTLMARKIMLEATQPVVDGNMVVHAAGDLFEPGGAPEGVSVREVIVDAPDVPADKPTAGVPAAKPAAKTAAK